MFGSRPILWEPMI